MIALRSAWTAVVLVAATAAGWIAAVAAPSLGMPAPAIGRSGLVTVAAVAVLALGMAWRVRRDRARPVAQRMDPLAAARTLILGQSAGFTGAALAGWHAGVGVQVAAHVGAGAPTVVDAILLGVGGLVLLAVGFVVEAWCRIPPEEDGTAGPNGQDGTSGRGRPARPETEGGYARARD